jgi:hypothetical protein
VITGTGLPVVDAKGVILVALSSSSGRWSLRNRYPADVCRRNGFDVLLLDPLSVVPSASRLFTEGDALQEMAVLAADWFRRHMVTNGDQDFETDPVQATG